MCTSGCPAARGDEHVPAAEEVVHDVAAHGQGVRRQVQMVHEGR